MDKIPADPAGQRHGIKYDPVTTCEVAALVRLNSDTSQLTLKAPRIAAAAEPGQFVNLEAGHFLRRPIGVMAVDRQQGLVQLGIRVQGRGTEWLSRLRPGTVLSVMGPLGKGFQLEGYRRVITVGGGTGVFPLYYVQQMCREQGIDGIAVCGYRSKADSVLTDHYRAAGCQVLFASDEGDLDVEGHAAAALEQLLQSLEMDRQEDTLIAACGPNIMMQAVAKIADVYQYDCQVSLEERMACGVGVCLVCVCKTKTKTGEANSRCCVDGPVFPAKEVVW